ncbi:MAG TPA: DNA polymerase III subunit delta [Verrucomicrobiae bacterium]|jgi:DNA polymerase-3 subunit delta|nr:DNA polymerase III subunit delta [Verrucomicrobiae bacterium]
MPAASSAKAPLFLICGDDDFGVKQRAREIFQKWSAEIGGTDHEIIDASVSNSGEALRALAKLREGLQTLPFFGSGKVVWLQNCNFLGEERAASAAAVTEALGDLAAELKSFAWQTVRLLVSAGKVDKRKTFYKTLDKLGTVEIFTGWSADDRDWASQASGAAERALAERHKEISADALGELVANVGPHVRQLHSEVEKLALYVGDRPKIRLEDVRAIVTRNKQARAFALGDALGDRNLPRALRCLDEELWEARRDPQRSEIGMLYGLVSKMRTLIFVKEMLAQKWIKPEADFSRFKSQLDRVPADQLPEDKKFNPLAINPYVLFRALGQARNYTQEELIAAMGLLLECNQKLISRSLDPSLLLQQTLIQIVARPGESPGRVDSRQNVTEGWGH